MIQELLNCYETIKLQSEWYLEKGIYHSEEKEINQLSNGYLNN